MHLGGFCGLDRACGIDAAAIEEKVQQHGSDGRQQNAGLEQRVQRVRHLLHPARCNERDQTGTDRDCNNVEIEAVGAEVDVGQEST